MKKKAYLMLLASMLIFGTNGLLVSEVSVSSAGIVFFRTLFGGAGLLAALLLQKKTDWGLLKKDLPALVLAGIFLGLNWVFLFSSYRLLGVSLSTLIYYAGPMLVVLVSPLLFREKTAWNKWVALGLVVVGAVFITGSVRSAEGSSSGLLYAFAAALCYALVVLTSKYVKHVKGLLCSFTEIAVAFMIVTVYLLATEGLPKIASGKELTMLLILGIVNTGAAYFLYFSSIRMLPGQTVGLCSYLDPVTALILSALVLHETMNGMQWLGALLIIGGAVFGELAFHKKAARE